MVGAPNIGPENLLGVPEGQDSRELRNRLDLALRYIANWYKATKGANEQDLWWTRIDQVRFKVEDAFRACDPVDIFPRASAVASYNEASAAFAALHFSLVAAGGTIPNPSLLDKAADAVGAALEFPAYLGVALANAVGNTISGTLGALLAKLTPWLIVAAVAGGVYVFRAPIARAVGKAAA